MLIYKIFQENELYELNKRGTTKGTKKDLSDGFIHFSKGSQLKETIEKHYQGVTNLTVLAVDTRELATSIKWEKSRNNQIFPHLYDQLSAKKIVWSSQVKMQNGVLKIITGSA